MSVLRATKPSSIDPPPPGHHHHPLLTTPRHATPRRATLVCYVVFGKEYKERLTPALLSESKVIRRLRREGKIKVYIIEDSHSPSDAQVNLMDNAGGMGDFEAWCRFVDDPSNLFEQEVSTRVAGVVWCDRRRTYAHATLSTRPSLSVGLALGGALIHHFVPTHSRPTRFCSALTPAYSTLPPPLSARELPASAPARFTTQTRRPLRRPSAARRRSSRFALSPPSRTPSRTPVLPYSLPPSLPHLRGRRFGGLDAVRILCNEGGSGGARVRAELQYTADADTFFNLTMLSTLQY